MNINFGSIGMREDTWIKYTYLFTTMERGFKDILTIEDPQDRVVTYNEIVGAIQAMVGALQFDLLAGDAPAPDKCQ